MSELEMTKEQREESYYKILNFLREQADQKKINELDFKVFKKIIRDNKYVSTYLRAMKLHMDNLTSIDDFIRMMDKHKDSKDWDYLVNYDVRSVLNSFYGSNYEVDPIKIMNNLINNALEREGKICDFRDSVNPDSITGRCQSGNHYELVGDDVELSDDEQKKFDKINDEDGYESACQAFDDKFNPVQTLYLTLYSDDDTHKFNDYSTEYVCEKCRDDAVENNDCEVSCDM